GQAAETMEARWNWTYPIAFSPREDNVLYVGSQHLWRSPDEGQTWARISPDLTRAEPETLGPSGGLIQLDQDGPEIYGTLFALAPSPLRKKLIWTGSDDGLVHVTRDEGKNWKDVTPPSLPPHTRIASIAASAHQPGTAYIATKRYEMADRRPLIFKTTDYGENWQAINGHLKAPEFAHAIAEDPQQPGVLYLGTETGVYVSIDDGDHWADLSLNMPVTPVIDLEVRGDDLVLATHGRGFFVLEGLGLVREIAKGRDWSRPQILSAGSATRKFEEAVFFAWLPQDVSGARLDIRDESGKTIRTLFGDRRLSTGLHRFRWNLRHTGAEVFPNMILESRNPVIGPIAAPGDHTIHLKAPGLSVSAAMEIDLHPRMQSALTERALKERLMLALKARDATSRANSTVIEIRKLRRKLSGDEGSEAAFLNAISAVESQLYQVKNESPKDKIALPIQLNDRLAGLMHMLSDGDGPPTEAQRIVLARLEGELDALLDTYQQIKTQYADEVSISLD
ncbi:MAG: glycosyl hydrolase, partial [Pseudomonadota bacterium]